MKYLVLAMILIGCAQKSPFVKLTQLTCSTHTPTDGELKGVPDIEDCGIAYDEVYVKKDLIKTMIPFAYHQKRGDKWYYNIMYCKINSQMKVEEECSEVEKLIK